jgi:type III pantothenate kinase
MDLYVDIGNSAVKWANPEDLKAGEVQHASSRDLGKTLISHWQSLDAPDRVYLSSVLQDHKLSELRDWMWRQWRLKPIEAVTRSEEFDVINGYRQPMQLGVDRWLALIAARSFSKGPTVVVDCGTATTIDAMDATGRHLGGVIIPGLQLFRRCLTEATDLPPLSEGDMVDYFATDSATGIASGAMLATLSSVERMTQMLQEISMEKVECLLTGGQAGLLSLHLVTPNRVMPNLVLQGLALQAAQADRT